MDGAGLFTGVQCQDKGQQANAVTQEVPYRYEEETSSL